MKQVSAAKSVSAYYLETAMAQPKLYDKVIMRSDFADQSGVIVKLTMTEVTVELMQIQNCSVLVSDLIELEPGVWECNLA